MTIDHEAQGGLCSRCRFTVGIPDVTLQENVDRWRVLEVGKRRLLFELQELGFSRDFLHGVDGGPPLTFRFAADTPEERVMTGHADGRITINLDEADSVHREITRQDFGEPQRTVIGHFRHEIGHYLWLRLVHGDAADEARRLFGDPDSPPYAEALERHHRNGPPAGWQGWAISGYATAHPWEDFAETSAYYLDTRAIYDTATRQGLAMGVVAERDFDELMRVHSDLAIKLNEINRTMGLVDLVPEVVSVPVMEKLEFIHRLYESAARAFGGAQAETLVFQAS